MNKRIRKAVALILAGSGLSAASMDAGAITILGTISNTGTTSASGAEATKNGLPLYAWDGNNSHIGVPNVFSGTSKNLGWAHNSIWYDVLITKPGNYTFSLVRTNPAQPGFNPAFTLWPVGAKPFDSQNCLGHCGDINNGKNGTHSYNQVAAPSAINASAWMLGNAGTAPGGGSFNWTPREGYGAVTGFIGYANSGPVGWKNGMPINKDPGSTDYNLSQDQNEVREGYVNISTGGGLGGSTLGADSNFSAPLGGGRAALNLYNLAAGHYLLAMGGSCPLNNCGSLKNGADYRLEITEITGGAPHASAKVASPSVRAGSLVLLDGSGSFDPDGDALTYIWTQTAGPAVTLKDATTQSASFTAPDAAVGQTLGFSLTVKSNDGQQSTASLSVAITSDNTPPVVKVPSQSVLEGAEVTLSSTVTDPDGDKPASYLWKQ
ncbi:PKD domain-containing protein, partial [Methylomagnum sp.]